YLAEHGLMRWLAHPIVTKKACLPRQQLQRKSWWPLGAIRLGDPLGVTGLGHGQAREAMGSPLVSQVKLGNVAV
ncbi:MAG: hypothetical protein ACKPKO_36395, partial [Candidatus Fonsibacter sp.]